MSTISRSEPGHHESVSELIARLKSRPYLKGMAAAVQAIAPQKPAPAGKRGSSKAKTPAKAKEWQPYWWDKL